VRNDDAKARLRELLAQLAREPKASQPWEELYEELYNDWKPFVASITYRTVMGDRGRAEDATQECFLRLFRYTDFAAFHSSEEFLAYLAVVARHAARDQLRLSREFPAGLAPQEIFSDPAAVTSEQARRAREQLEDVLQSLTWEERRLADLLMEGHSDDVIANTLQISYQAAAVRIHRLRKRLLREVWARGG
jgi:RNA polymerase sigma factor (sigma-70 family)